MGPSFLSLRLQNGSKTFSIPTEITQNTVLYFMRASSCAQCNRHTRELDALAAELQTHSTDVIIIVPEDMKAADKVKSRNKLTVSVMAGNQAAHALAGLDKKLLGAIQQSGTVVINKAGKVLYKRIATNPENSYNAKEFREYITTIV